MGEVPNVDLFGRERIVIHFHFSRTQCRNERRLTDVRCATDHNAWQDLVNRWQTLQCFTGLAEPEE